MVGMVERQMGVGTICMAAFGAFRRSVAWAVLGVLLGVLAPPALAQFGMMNDGDAMAMAIGRESAERYAELMGFDQAQREAALMLHGEYLDRYKQAADTLQEAMRSLQEEVARTRDWEAMMKPMGKIMLGWMERAKQLEDQFFEDLRMLAIGPEQEAAFERVRRMHRREQMKMFGQMGSAGGAVDLFDVARNAGVLENDRVEAMLRSYEAEIDPIYKRTIEKMWAFGRQQLEQMQIGFEWNEETIQKMQESMAEFQDMAKQAREINLRYARQVMQLLPEAEQASWDRKVKERIWPTVYRPSKAERQIEAAMKLEDLSAQQRESLEALAQSYAREAAPINERWAKALDEQAEQQGGNWWGFGEDDSQVEAIAQEREELDGRFVERVRSMLTPEQLERMPEVSASGFDADAVLRQFNQNGG